MKKLFYRVTSSRSFTRFLSIVAFAVVAFGAQESLFVQQALAGTKCCRPGSTTNCTCVSTATCPSPYTNKITGVNCPLPYATGSSSGSSSGTINSTITCENISGINNVELTGVSQSILQGCQLNIDGVLYPPGVGARDTCLFDIFYSGIDEFEGTFCDPDTEAGTSTLTAVAFCGGSPSSTFEVAGTLNCNPEGKTGDDLPPICQGDEGCIMRLNGITDLSYSQCDTVFPEDLVADLAERQVLRATVITDNLDCTGKIIEHGDIALRYCNSGKFDAELDEFGNVIGGTASACIFPEAPTQIAQITTTTVSAVLFDVDFNPKTINVKCGEKKDQGKVKFTIFGNDTLDVTLIEQSSLRIEGTIPNDLDCNDPKDANKDGFLDLTCQVKSCPSLGPALLANRDPNSKRVDITVTGSLESGTAILGEDLDVKTSP
jgi:hypothetical protein